MSITGFIMRNALRNKRRLLLTVLSAGVSLFLFVTLMVVLREFTNPPSDGGASERLAVRNKVSLANPLPARQLPIIEKIPGVLAVMPLSYFGGKFDDDVQLMWPQFAVDPAKFRTIFGEAKMPEEQWEAWIKNRTGCIVGRDTFNDPKYNMKLGGKLNFISGIYPCSVELTIVGVYHGTVDDRSVWFHDEYFQEAMGQWGKVGDWWIRITHPDRAAEVCAAIEAAFANTADEVRAETERAFQASFVSMWGNIRILIGGICTLVTITLLLVTASTMSMSIRERFRELAILKALGYKRRDLFAFVLAESFGLVALGAMLGVGGAWALCASGTVQKASGGMFVSFEATPQILGLALLIACALALISALAPGIAAARMSVVDGLKTLD
jgi:putative ABC transport system permease protein